MSLTIPPEFIKRIRLQAEKDYPSETCGILIGPQGKRELVTGIYPCRNVQDEYHAQDPVSFPRDSRTAYFIDPRDLLKIQKQARRTGDEIRLIYHSHVDAGAYLSEEDERVALAEGEPVYPGVSYLVISVSGGKGGEIALFDWDEKAKRFSKVFL